MNYTSTRHKATVTVLSALALTSVFTGALQAQTTAAAKFVPFDEFLQSVRGADANDMLARPEVKIAGSSAMEEMRQHLLKLYGGVAVNHSYVLDSQTIDCVPLTQQPAVRALGLAKFAVEPPASAIAGPAEAKTNSTPRLSQIPAGKTSDDFGNALGCEAQTIPMTRITLEQLSHFKTLHEFFEKGPNGSGQAPKPGKSVPAGGPAHKYSITYQYVNNLGDNADINLWRPYVFGDIGEIFSLAQSWTIGYGSGGDQTVEVGWQNYPARTGTESSVVFTYYTADGYVNTGCYDLTCGAFVQVNRSIALGVPFAPQYYSVSHGPQYELQLQYYFYQGNWWLNADGTWIGYYPGRLFGSGQLSQYANLLEFGSESVGNTVWPAEGSGLFAANGFEYSAYQRELWYRALNSLTYWDTLTPYQPSPSCYSATTPGYASNWGIYFFFGGPGGASCQ